MNSTADLKEKIFNFYWKKGQLNLMESEKILHINGRFLNANSKPLTEVMYYSDSIVHWRNLRSKRIIFVTAEPWSLICNLRVRSHVNGCRLLVIALPFGRCCWTTFQFLCEPAVFSL